MSDYRVSYTPSTLKPFQAGRRAIANINNFTTFALVRWVIRYLTYYWMTVWTWVRIPPPPPTSLAKEGWKHYDCVDINISGTERTNHGIQTTLKRQVISNLMLPLTITYKERMPEIHKLANINYWGWPAFDSRNSTKAELQTINGKTVSFNKPVLDKVAA